MNLHIGDQVNVTITTADDMGYLVTINEHNVEGFIALSSAHRKNKTRFAIGTQHAARIIRMNNNNNNIYIDLELINRV